MIRNGEWQVHSVIDPRWNNKGEGLGDAFCCPDMEEWIEKCKKEFGAPPEDATKSFWKY